MSSDLILGKFRRDFTADESLWVVGDLKATIDSVMIGERNERHSLFPQSPVQASRIGVAIGKFETSKQPLDRAIAET